MSTIPSAHRFYPDNYHLYAEPSTLKQTQKSPFDTHTTLWAQRLHQLSETLFLPARFNATALARIIVPLPGSDVDHRLKRVAIRVAAIALWAITLLPALLSLAIAFPLRMIAHPYRPSMSYLASPTTTQQPELVLSEQHPLHLRTHNTGLVTSTMSILGSLRDPILRAQEIAESIQKDPHEPSVICFQEVFHEDASQILCEKLKEKYPYIIHTVAPHILGLSSGHFIASKYPIQHAEFHRFNNMIGPERASPRGILRIKLHTTKGPLLIYSAHLQAVLGESRAKARTEQILMIQNLLTQDKKKEPNALQVVAGDFNTTRITPWGDDLLSPPGQAEETPLNTLNTHFEDLYLKDHDPVTGTRTQGSCLYLDSDNQRLGKTFKEPNGSWYHGSLSTLHPLYRFKLYLERKKHKRPYPQKAPFDLPANVWGTSTWQLTHPVNPARFDYILLPKLESSLKLEGRAEIRRTIPSPRAQSASSDHLPLDARVWVQHS